MLLPSPCACSPLAAAAHLLLPQLRCCPPLLPPCIEHCCRRIPPSPPCSADVRRRGAQRVQPAPRPAVQRARRARRVCGHHDCEPPGQPAAAAKPAESALLAVEWRVLQAPGCRLPCLCAAVQAGPAHASRQLTHEASTSLPPTPQCSTRPCPGLLAHVSHRRDVPGGAGGQRKRRAAALAPLLGPRAAGGPAGQGVCVLQVRAAAACWLSSV